VQQFQKAINQSGDMITVSMKILGDPFYLGDSGFGNYTAQGTSNDDVTSDGTINYERSMVFIKINFRNPIDINGNLYDFPGPKAIPIISGLYKVNTLESTFDRGMFAQTLELSRMPNYDLTITDAKSSAPPPPDDITVPTKANEAREIPETDVVVGGP
jgi:hypothetical protein